MTQQVIALDLGGTKTTAALVEVTAGHARVRHRGTRPTPARDGAAAVLASALALADEVVAQAGTAAPVAVGIASAGVIDAFRGVVTHATDHLPGWPGTDLAGAFGERFGLPVAALNDVHAHGLGEALFGAGAGHRSMLLVAVGTGIGGCHVIDGAPVIGATYSAGHLGHVAVPEATGVPCPCGRVGHLEGIASGPGIHTGFLAREGFAADTREVAALAASGDAKAQAVIRGAGFATGRMIGGLLNVINPEVVVLTGGVAEIGELWLDAVRAGVAHDAMDVAAATALLPATVGVEAALLGAAHWSLTSSSAS